MIYPYRDVHTSVCTFICMAPDMSMSSCTYINLSSITQHTDTTLMHHLITALTLLCNGGFQTKYTDDDTVVITSMDGTSEAVISDWAYNSLLDAISAQKTADAKSTASKQEQVKNVLALIDSNATEDHPE